MPVLEEEKELDTRVKENILNFVFIVSLTKGVGQEGVKLFWIYRHKDLSINPRQPPPSDTIFNAIWGNVKSKNWNVRYRQVKLANGAKINVRYNQVSAIAVSAI